ncbi:hypothetical protein [Pectobacterium carotovorum]|uniref:hypothetical protein n=1 Tax=Pectobacterium carotovorum TaxID=554 RepID=UPI0030179B50
MLNKNLDLQDQIERTIHHELGHWLMSRHVGFDVGEIAISMNNNSQLCGHATVHPVPIKQLSNVNDIYNHILNRVSVLCAGVIADIEWHKKFASSNYEQADTEHLYANGIMDETGLSDRGKIEEHLFIMNSIKNFPSHDPEENSKQRNQILSEVY